MYGSDKMTKAAAKEEQSGGMYAVFNDVIKFDDEKDVWYFPNLWDGNPPMARVNPGYSESALKLKSRLISGRNKARAISVPSLLLRHTSKICGMQCLTKTLFSASKTPWRSLPTKDLMLHMLSGLGHFS